MPFVPSKTPIATLLWLARRSAEDGYEAWWHGNYGLTPRVLSLMDRECRDATEADRATLKGHTT